MELVTASPQSATAPEPNGADEAFAFPATVGQRVIWSLNQLNPGNPAYNIALRFRLSGPLRVPALQQALTEVVRRHEALRTTFATEGDALLQVVSPPPAVALPLDDLRGAADPQKAGEELTAEEAARGFDLEKGPLFRARLLQLADEDHILLLTMHQSVTDGWSTGIINREFVALYAAFEAGDPSPLPEPALQFGDFAVWQDEWLRTPAAAAQLDYWKHRLTGLQPVQVPHDAVPAGPRGAPSAIESVLLPRALTDQLTKLGHGRGATFFMICLACLKILLRNRTGQDDLALNVLSAGRSKTELEPVVGRFVNTVVFRTDLAGDPTFDELLGRVSTTVLDAMANQDIPFGQVAEAFAAQRRASRLPPFRLNLIFQRAFLNPAQAGSVNVTPIRSLSPGAMVDLNFFMVERAEGWRVSCEYGTDQYLPSTVQYLLADFRALLDGAATDPGRRLSAFAFTAPAPQPIPDPGPAPPRAAATGPVLDVRPTTTPGAGDEVETQLTEMWREVLGIEEIDPDADFFDLGGFSLTAARLVVKVQHQFAVRLSPAVLFENPTVRRMARVLARATNWETESPLAPDRLRGSVPHTNGVASRNGKGAHGSLTTAPSRSTVPFFFPSPEGPLFGVYAPPAERDRGEGVVLCAPPGHEYMTTHICLRLLATELSRVGFHVLRFDYSCLGHSWGSFEEATADRWVRDIGTALRELAARSGTSALSLVGLRLGGALAYRAACAARVEHLLLWDPITGGREYLEQLRRKQARIDPARGAPARGALEDLLGYSYSAGLVTELEQLDLAAGVPQCDRVSFVLSAETSGAARLQEYLRRPGRRPAVRTVAAHDDWDDDDFTRHVMLHQARRAVVALLGEGAP